MKRFLISIAFALIATVANAGSDSGNDYKCASVKSRDGVAEVRIGPGTQHASKHTLRNGQSVYFEHRQGDWVFINATIQNKKDYTDIEGWVYAPLLKKIECAC